MVSNLLTKLLQTISGQLDKPQKFTDAIFKFSFLPCHLRSNHPLYAGKEKMRYAFYVNTVDKILLALDKMLVQCPFVYFSWKITDF